MSPHDRDELLDEIVPEGEEPGEEELADLRKLVGELEEVADEVRRERIGAAREVTEAPGEATTAAVLARLANDTPGRPGWPRLLTWLPAVAAVFLVVLGVALWTRGGESGDTRRRIEDNVMLGSPDFEYMKLDPIGQELQVTWKLKRAPTRPFFDVFFHDASDGTLLLELRDLQTESCEIPLAEIQEWPREIDWEVRARTALESVGVGRARSRWSR